MKWEDHSMAPNLISYFDRNNPMECALAIQDSINPIRKICVWKKAVAFLGSLPAPLLHTDWIPKGSGDFVIEVGDGKWHTKIRVTYVCGNTFEQEYETRSTNRKKSNFHKLSDITSPHWMRAFDINEPIYTELCQEFNSTYEFDEVIPDDELMTKKVIKFRLCGRAHPLSVLDFARRLGLYTSAEIQDDGFDTSFLGGLRNDNHFNANQYWLSISSEEELLLSRSSVKTIRKTMLRVL
ncbi:hypothetical protein Tco_0271406 [Tanacetum coccineum]